MAISLNFDTFAAWFISAEINSASNFPHIFRESIESWEEREPWTRNDDDFWEEFAAMLINDSRDDLVANHESLIMLTDRANEFDDEAGEDGTRLEDDMHGWLDDDRLVRMLAKAYQAQFEFMEKVEALAAQRAEMRSMNDY